LLSVADNQRPATIALDRAKIAVSVGDIHSEEWEHLLLSALEKWSDSERLRKFSQNAAAIVDGKGALRIAGRMMDHIVFNGSNS
jgi:spore coat polysaccharide biosynthesis predicted glycosyltransferase SpsG